MTTSSGKMRSKNCWNLWPRVIAPCWKMMNWKRNDLNRLNFLSMKLFIKDNQREFRSILMKPSCCASGSKREIYRIKNVLQLEHRIYAPDDIREQKEAYRFKRLQTDKITLIHLLKQEGMMIRFVDYFTKCFAVSRT